MSCSHRHTVRVWGSRWLGSTKRKRKPWKKATYQMVQREAFVPTTPPLTSVLSRDERAEVLPTVWSLARKKWEGFGRELERKREWNPIRQRIVREWEDIQRVENRDLERIQNNIFLFSPIADSINNGLNWNALYVKSKDGGETCLGNKRSEM